MTTANGIPPHSRRITVRAAAAETVKTPVNLADGLGIHLSVAGKTVAGEAAFTFSTKDQAGWKSDVIPSDENAYEASDIRTRNFITVVISVAGLAALIRLLQSGRAYLRAVELARRQSEFMAAVSH